MRQDSTDRDTQRVASHFATTTLGAVRTVSRRPAADERNTSDAWRPANMVFLLRIFLECLRYPNLLLLSDAARLSQDALPLYASVSWLLEADPTLLCVAGASGLGGTRGAGEAGGQELLLRTEVVPPHQAGLMFHRRAGSAVLRAWSRQQSVTPQVPSTGAGWLRWLRAAAIKARQQCIVPDVPRVAPVGVGEMSSRSSDVEGSNQTGGGSKMDQETELDAVWGLANNSTSSELSGWMDIDHSWLLEPSYSRLFVQVRGQPNVGAPSCGVVRSAFAYPLLCIAPYRRGCTHPSPPASHPCAVCAPSSERGGYATHPKLSSWQWQISWIYHQLHSSQPWSLLIALRYRLPLLAVCNRNFARFVLVADRHHQGVYLSGHILPCCPWLLECRTDGNL